jgi:hypothetical protein
MGEPYNCEACGGSGVRLFREYQTFDPKLRCSACLVVAGIPRIADRFEWWVAAVPTDSGGFWGYTSVPPERAVWWRALPEQAEAA